jgi:hypothetical protein
MREHDYPHFSKMLDQVCGVLGKGNYKPDSQASAIWFRTLAAYDLEAVRMAFDAHVRDPDRGRFIPVPADIIAKLIEQAGRPSQDEAWAIAVKGADEAASVAWTDDIAEAWGIAIPVWKAGDEVGARMAFKDAYERITRERQGTAVRWWASLGHDRDARETVVRQAAASGLLPNEAALMLQAPDSGTLKRLAANAQNRPDVREKLLTLRDKLAARSDADEYVPNPDVARTAELKARAQAQFEAECKRLGIDPSGDA